VLTVLLILGASQAASPRDTWIVPQATSPGEAALLDIMGSADTPKKKVDALRRLSSAQPGTSIAGLAQLAAGLFLLDSGSAAEAIPSLRDPDIYRSGLGDLGLLSLGRALEETGAFPQASQSHLALATSFPQSPFACVALYRGADALVRARQESGAPSLLDRVVKDCPDERAAALLRLAQVHELQGDLASAAAAYDRLDREAPTSAQAREAGPRLRLLRPHLPALSPAARVEQEMAKAASLQGAGRAKEAVTILKSLAERQLVPEYADTVHLRLARALLAAGRSQEATRQLSLVPQKSPALAEASFLLAEIRAKQRRSADPFESVATSFPKTAWAEEALLNLAAYHNKQTRPELAAGYYRRLLEDFPDGRYFERAAWWSAWWDYRSGRWKQAAEAFENAARLRPTSSSSAGFLYWAGRARERLGEPERARGLFRETVRGFKHSYHGLRAAAALGLPPDPATSFAESPLDEAARLPEPHATRIRNLLLIGRSEEALEEIAAIKDNPQAQAMAAFFHWRQGRLRTAIITMKKAYPEWRSESGDQLPGWIWRILFPLDFSQPLLAKARDRRLDPALVAALVCQESTFDPGAVSRAGARGLMQVIPSTGRRVARTLGFRYRREDLHNPDVSLDLGTNYLRQMIDHYGGRIERALAAYNAGPGRVNSWTTAWPDLGTEEFIESIPLAETRHYVMTVLAHRQQYRRLYNLMETPAPAGATASNP
jgi:soluble lytic murein transglycosylase